jgi:hypothetical protein
MKLIKMKETLMHIVQEADHKLTGLLFAVANEYNDTEECYSKEELAFFMERKLAFFNSNKEGNTVEEAHARIRSNYKNGV